MVNWWENNGNSDRLFLGSRITASGDYSHEIKTLAPWKKSYDKPRQHIKKQRYYFANKGPSSQSYGFSSSHVWMWELDHKESWVLKNWCFWTAVLEKTLEGPLDYKEIKPVHPKGNQPWIFTGRTDAEAEVPILRPPDAKNRVIGKIADAGKDWRQEEKGTIEEEMDELDGITNSIDMSLCKLQGLVMEGNLACCSPWGLKELERTERLIWTEFICYEVGGNSKHESPIQETVQRNK